MDHLGRFVSRIYHRFFDIQLLFVMIIICHLYMNLNKIKFELRMRKWKAFQYRYYN